MNFVILLTGVLFIAAGFGIPITARASEDENKPDKSKLGRVLTIIGMLIVIMSSSFAIIPTGYTGVRTTFGQISSKTVQNGFNWKVPFVQGISKVNNKQQDITFEDKVWAETTERTSIFYKNVTVTYQINPEKSAWIYANVSDYKDNLVSSSLVASAIKSSSKTLSDANATNRSKIEPLVMQNVQSSLDEKYGKDIVVVNKVVISDADFEDSYNKAIAEKQQAQLDSEKQSIVNQKNVDKAKADAEAKLTAADAESKANKKLERSLTDRVLKNAYIDKWNGQMPDVVTSKDGSIMMDVGK